MTRGRKAARVVAAPGTMSGQPRIEGMRMNVTQLLVYMRGGMTVEEISAEWPELPAGWFDAIIEWVDAQSASEDTTRERATRADADAVAQVLDIIPDVPAPPGDEIDEAAAGRPEAEELEAFGSGNVFADLGVPIRSSLSASHGSSPEYRRPSWRRSG